MNLDQNNFHELQRVLKLKRYEQPPPGYFARFSREIRVRIEAGDHLAEASLFEKLGWDAPWLRRFWVSLETRPVFAGVFGVVVCGLLVSGILFSERSGSNPLNVNVISTPLTESFGNGLRATEFPPSLPLERVAAASDPGSGVAPSGQVLHSLFQDVHHPTAQPVVWPGNN